STDHSAPVDFFATPDAAAKNMAAEYRRNSERYRFMKWAASTLASMRVHPPGTGIMHTINLERLATVVRAAEGWAFPDTLIGTDSHTPMINGIGVFAWGVGGLEAESVMFGMPVTLPVPNVLGVRLTGRLRDGVLATDLALTVTERLRRTDLAGRFVEFIGPGVSTLTAGTRAVVANMAPEYGASTGYFAIDDNTLEYLRQTGRSAEQIELVRVYAKRQGLWFTPDAAPTYTDTIEIDLSAVETSVAGPRRPQDRLSPKALQPVQPIITQHAMPASGAVAIAAITSCTNTSDPLLLIAAGLLARKAHALGLKPPPWVKTSLAPGSPRAETLLRRADLLSSLEALGFGIVGYGCTTCIGNSGALTAAIQPHTSTAVAVLSGNRNFPGRVHSDLGSAFLASPPLVIAYALAGDVNRNIRDEPLGVSTMGAQVHLADIWPTSAEIDAALTAALDPADVDAAFSRAEKSAAWAALEAPTSAVFPWDTASNYIRRPPFAVPESKARLGHYIAAPLLVLGDDITTDHISPVGQIPPSSDAGKYLIARGEDPHDLNVYAARRANWEVMLRGLFTNRHVVNLLDPALPAGHTIDATTGEQLALWQIAARYQQQNTSIVIVAGARYGMGSSRDWAAKGVALLNVRAVLAVSFEQIHRTNLIGMGVLPVRLPGHISPETLRLTVHDRIEIAASAHELEPRGEIQVTVHRADGRASSFTAIAAIETSLEVAVLQKGGMIPAILHRVMATE
ncbi:MAG: aconitate hydratase AcnA, partial [Rhodospirillaceae bacterium]|nr:aconitate hydratase AcnA [Rhodospirillaceae bacterium]